MREEKKLKKIARDRLNPVSDEIISKLESEFPQYAAETPLEKGRTTPRRGSSHPWISVACSVASAAVVLCAIIIPVCMLNSGNGGGGVNSNVPNIPYQVIDSELTVKEYNEANGTNFLYFDWYDSVECKTELYVSIETQELWVIEETWGSDSNGSIELSAIINGSKISYYSHFMSFCINETLIGSCTVNWNISEDGKTFYAAFLHDNIKYCLFVETFDTEPPFGLLYELLGEL